MFQALCSNICGKLLKDFKHRGNMISLDFKMNGWGFKTDVDISKTIYKGRKAAELHGRKREILNKG